MEIVLSTARGNPPSRPSLPQSRRLVAKALVPAEPITGSCRLIPLRLRSEEVLHKVSNHKHQFMGHSMKNRMALIGFATLLSWPIAEAAT